MRTSWPGPRSETARVLGAPLKATEEGRGLPGQGMTRLEVWRLRGHTGLVGSWGVPLFARLLASSLCLPRDGDCKGTHVKPELKGYRVRFHIPSYSALARFPIQLIPGRRRGGALTDRNAQVKRLQLAVSPLLPALRGHLSLCLWPRLQPESLKEAARPPGPRLPDVQAQPQGLPQGRGGSLWVWNIVPLGTAAMTSYLCSHASSTPSSRPSF